MGCHASPAASTSWFLWHQGSRLESGGCFATLPISVLVVHTTTWAGNMARDTGIGVGPHCGDVGSLCTFRDQQQVVEQCPPPGRVQPRLPEGPAASPHPSSAAICQGFLLINVKLTKLTL